MSEPGRPITEAEYREWLARRAQAIAAELSAGLPEGMSFAWETLDEPQQVDGQAYGKVVSYREEIWTAGDAVGDS